MTCFGSSILLLEIVEDITYTQTSTANLISIGRANTLTRRTYLILTLLSLVSSIEHTVGRHNQVSLLRNVQTLLQRMTTGLQCLGFLHEEVGSQHYAITNDVYLTTLEDTRRDRAQHILLPLKLQCMTGIGTALKTGNNIVLGSQHVDYLTLSFVAPLQTEQDIYFTLIHCLYLFIIFVFCFFSE